MNQPRSGKASFAQASVPHYLPKTASFEMRMPLPAKHAAVEPMLRPHHGFEALVSAVCYLSLSREDDVLSLLEAIQICHDLAQELHEDHAQPGADLDRLEDLVWQSKQIKWERQKSIDAALRFVTGRDKSHHVAGGAREMVPRHRWARLWRP